MHVVFEMKWKKEVQFRCRHSDRVWTQIDSSSWQLPGSSLGFYGANAEIWSVVLGRDQAGSPARAPKPHKHKLAENKVTAEKQPLVQGRLHSTVEPKEMENYTPGTAVQNCSDSQERVIHWAFHLLSKVVTVFLLFCFSYPAGWRSLKQLAVLFLWTDTDRALPLLLKPTINACIFFKIVARRPTNHLSLNGDDIRCFSAPSCMFFQLEAPAKTLKKQWPKSFTVIKTVTRSRRRLLKMALCDRALSSCTFRDKLASGLFFLWFFMQKAKKRPDLIKSRAAFGAASWSNHTHRNTFEDSYVREARDSGAARSPEPAAKPCGSCRRFSKAAALRQHHSYSRHTHT